MQSLEGLLRGNYIATAQAVQLLSGVSDTEVRLILAVAVFHRLADAANSFKLLEELSEREYEKLTAAIGSRTFACKLWANLMRAAQKALLLRKRVERDDCVEGRGHDLI